MENPKEHIKEVLDRISEPCPIDDGKHIYKHKDDETGKTILVSISEKD